MGSCIRKEETNNFAAASVRLICWHHEVATQHEVSKPPGRVRNGGVTLVRLLRFYFGFIANAAVWVFGQVSHAVQQALGLKP